MNSTSTHSRLRPTLLALTAALLAAPTFAQESTPPEGGVISINVQGRIEANDPTDTVTSVLEGEGNTGFVPVFDKNWNEVNPQKQTVTVASAKNETGAATSATITLRMGGSWHLTAKGSAESRAARQERLGWMGMGYCEVSDTAQDELELRDIPYTQYSLILYLASDHTDAANKWAPVKVTSGETVTYYSYPNGPTEDNAAVSSAENPGNWGAVADVISVDNTGTYGHDVVLIPGLSGDVSVDLGTHGHPTCSGLAGLQIVCTGEIILPIEPVTFEGVPEGWGTAPTEAYTDTVSETTQLELLPLARQEPEGARARNVMHITGATNTPTVYGVTDSTQGDKSTLERDVWLKISGGAYASVIGGKDNGWSNNHANHITGNLLVELTGEGTTVQTVVGSNIGGSNGAGGEGDGMTFTGDTLVTLTDGAKVSGTVVGSGVSQHRKRPVHNGNATVRVYTLQDENGDSGNYQAISSAIVGGAVSNVSGNQQDPNWASALPITGNTAVEVVLNEGAGTFAKTIYGGSCNVDQGTGSFAITGNTAVTVDANGVTFPDGIYAGGKGPKATVSGTATVTLKGGVFIGEVAPGVVTDETVTTGTSALVIEVAEDKTVDVSNAIIGEFTTSTVTLSGGTLALGAMRLPEPTLAADASGTITIALSMEEIADGSVTLCEFAGEAVPETLTVSAPDLQVGTWAAQAVEGTLRYVRTDAAQNLTWTTPAEGTDWSDGLSGFKPGDNATFGTNEANASVTLDQDILAGAVTVLGDYTLNGNGALTANTVTISEGGTLTLGTANFASARYVRWSPTARTTTGNNTDQGVALAEFGLYRFGERVDMTGVTVTATQAQSVGSDNNHHEAAYLLDGNTSTKWYWSVAPATFTNCSITFDAGEGQAFVFDAYNLAMADQNGRNPREWKLEISNDNSTWTLLDQQSFTTEEANTWTSSAWLDEAFQVGQVRNVAITVAEGVTVNGALTAAGGIEGDVTFGETGTLKLAAGKYLMINGAVTAQEGGIALDTSAVLTESYVGQTFLVAQNGLSFIGVPEGFVVNEVQMTDVLSQYILAKDAPFPWKATLTGDTTWTEATWMDANGEAIAPTQWEVISALRTSAVEITVNGTATLSDLPYYIGGLTVVGTAPLTLSGGPLHTSSLTVEAGAELHTDTAQFVVTALNDETPASVTVNGTWVMNTSSGYTLPAISGTGTVVKTGAGTLSLGSGTTVTPIVRVEEGVLALASDGAYADIPNIEVVGDAIFGIDKWNNTITDAEATITLIDGGAIRLQNGNGTNNHRNRKITAAVVVDNDGSVEKAARILGSSNGNSSNFAGGISGKGTLLFTGGNANGYSIREVGVADGLDGVLKLRVADANSDGSGDGGAARITFAVDSTYTGGTEIVNLLHTAAADALGKGPVTIEATGRLVVDSGTTLNVYGAIKSAGTIAGAIALQNGASIDASAGAVTFDTLSVAEGVTIPVTLPETVAVGTELATWTTGPADAAAFSAELAAGLALAVESTTLKVVEGAPSGDLTWENGATDWATGLPGYAAGANVTFGPNTETGAENVVVPADTPAAGAVTVSGDYALGAENFGADSLEVTADGSLTLLSQPISARYVTFMTLSAGTSSISEFTLYRDGKEVDLEGMTIGGVESAMNAVDGSTETEATFGQAMTFIQIDAGEGKTISFDSYNVATGADAAKFPGGWYLLAGSTQTPNLQTDMKELMGMDGVEAPAAGAYLWETPRALSGATGSNLAITDTVTVAGTVGGNGTITAKSIAFAEGATIKPTGVGYLTLSAEEITGATELVLDTSALNLPEEADPTTEVIFLFTSVETDFTFTGVPEGYRVRNLGGTSYVLTKDFTQPFTAEVGAGTTAWAHLKWADDDGVEIPAPILTLLAGDVANLEFALTATAEGATVQVAAREPGALTINASDHRLTLTSPMTVAFAPKALTVNGDLYVGDGALTLPAETTLNATLTYATFSKDEVSGTVTGAGSIVKTGTGTLAIAEGANIGVNVEVQAGTLAPAANTTLADLALVDGATLDLSAGPLAITGTLTVPGIVDEADAPVINVIPPTDFVITEEPQALVTYIALDSGELEPADLAVMTEDENWVVDFGETAITVWLEPTVTLPEGVVGDETGGFSEDAQAAILGAVAGTEGVTSVTSVTLTLNGQSADTATFNDLAACVADLPLSVSVDENGVATVTAACNLTITSIEIVEGKLVVAATLTDADGESTPLTLKSGVKVELVPVTLDGTEPGAALGEVTVGADGALTLPSPEATAGTVLFKVRLTPPTAQ